ncbi:MAG: zf-HC2 domain-containing protein [Planctomycetes bacterium]|nr:zf-HC2 domain-containing protein [Planctomycetota bacterium]
MTDPNDSPCQHAPGAVTCEECTGFLLDYVDGTLPAEQRERFEAHLGACPDCEVYLANYREATRLARASGRSDRDVGPPPVPRALVDAILAARKRQG